jgi:hypothetical protein
VDRERPRLPRVLAQPTTTPQAPAVTTTDSSNDEPTTEGSSTEHSAEFKSA